MTLKTMTRFGTSVMSPTVMLGLVGVVAGMFAPPTAYAQEDYPTMRAKFQHNVDRCDLINVQQIVQIQTMPVNELKKQQKTIQKLLKQTKDYRQACYEEAKNALADVMAAGFAESEKNPNDTTLSLQLELDEQLPQLLEMRQRISGELLESMAEDVTYTIKNERKLKRKTKGKDLYLHESDRTASLIKQDMGIVLSVEGRQLQLDELLTPPTRANLEPFVKLKLKKAMHYLARTLMIYEDVQAEKRHVPVLLAKLRSEYLYAAGQMNELTAMDPELSSISAEMRPSMQQLLNRIQLLELDIEGALRDFRNDSMEEDLSNWLSEVYQDLSQLTLAIKTQLQWFGVEQVVSSDEDLPDLPKDLEAFIEKAEEAGKKAIESEKAKAEEASKKADETKKDAKADSSKKAE